MSFVFDPEDPAVHADLHAHYRTLRDEHPVYRHPTGKLWTLSRYEDVENALLDPERFHSAGVQEANALLPMIVYMDGARHHALRNLVSKVFTPRRIQELEPRVRATVRTLLDGWSGKDRGDLMHDFALQLPNLIISEMIGIPEERRHAFLECTEALIRVGAAGAEDIRDPAAGIYGEFTRLLEERRAERRDDLMSALIDAEVDGQRLSQDELLGFCFLLVVGGSDTTTNLIGNGAVLLARHPEQRDWLAADPARIPNALEEMFRYESPTQSQPRRPSRDIELHGETIPEGARVVLLLGSGNLDERRWADAERFDVTRDVGWHLALGKGVHYCLGANLARLEARVSFEEFLERHPRYELIEPPTWAPSRWARHHPTIPIRFD